MKRLVYCLDGTTNTYDAAYPTNVVMTHRSIAPRDRRGVEQISYYDEGVGTRLGEKLLGGALGLGLMENVVQAYRHLCEHWEPGDQIFIFGFSRGAYTARSFAGLVRHCGIATHGGGERFARAAELYKARLQGDDEALLQWRAECSPGCVVDAAEEAWRAARGSASGAQPIKATIRYLGVWDTVKTIGVDEARYDWHDHRLWDQVEFARHAVALDERRRKFDVTLWEEMDSFAGLDEDGERTHQQLWFPGDHGSVGGGGPVRGLSDSAFDWVIAGARRAGLDINTDDGSQAFDIRPDMLAPLENTPAAPWYHLHVRVPAMVIGWFGRGDRVGPTNLDAVHHSARVRWAAPAEHLPGTKRYRPGSLAKVQSLLEDWLAANPISPSHFRALVENAKRDSLADDELKVVNLGGATYWVHIIKKDETLSALASKYYRDAAQWSHIHAANLLTIPNPDIVYVGQRVLVPTELPPAGVAPLQPAAEKDGASSIVAGLVLQSI